MDCILVWSVEPFVETSIDMMNELIFRLKEFMEIEVRSCSMDFGCITPLYLFRSWGGTVSSEDIEAELKELRNS